MQYTRKIGFLAVGVAIAAGAAVSAEAASATPAAHPMSNGAPICEWVATSGSLVGSHGPYGTCITNSYDLPVGCVTSNPTIGTLVGLYLEACVPD